MFDKEIIIELSSRVKKVDEFAMKLMEDLYLLYVENERLKKKVKRLEAYRTAIKGKEIQRKRQKTI